MCAGQQILLSIATITAQGLYLAYDRFNHGY